MLGKKTRSKRFAHGLTFAGLGGGSWQGSECGKCSQLSKCSCHASNGCCSFQLFGGHICRSSKTKKHKQDNPTCLVACAKAPRLKELPKANARKKDAKQKVRAWTYLRWFGRRFLTRKRMRQMQSTLEMLLPCLKRLLFLPALWRPHLPQQQDKKTQARQPHMPCSMRQSAKLKGAT